MRLCTNGERPLVSREGLKVQAIGRAVSNDLYIRFLPLPSLPALSIPSPSPFLLFSSHFSPLPLLPLLLFPFNPSPLSHSPSSSRHTLCPICAFHYSLDDVIYTIILLMDTVFLSLSPSPLSVALIFGLYRPSSGPITL